MFRRNSRYYGKQNQDTVVTDGGRSVDVVKIRRIPATPGDPVTVMGSDRLDTLAQEQYKDSTRFWHIADANTELEAGDLVSEPGATLLLPKL